MKYLATGSEMQKIDSYSIEKIGIPGIVLMEKAAMAMEEEIIKRFQTGSRVLIVTEKGNNGGDGLALARLLSHRGYQTDVYEVGQISRASDSYQIQRNILEKIHLPILEELPDKKYDLVVDAIFGVGLKREITGLHKKVIDRLNHMEGYKIAVDVPSGVNATDGQIMGISFLADLTITFGLNKVGLLLPPGAGCANEVVVKDIGFPEEAVAFVSPGCFHYTKEDLGLLPQRKAWSNKGTYGRILLIAGSKNMAGAAYLSAKAAYRAGAGLVRIFTCEENREILQTKLPEAILTTYTRKKEARKKLADAIAWADVIGIGPGLGMGGFSAEVLEIVFKEGKVPVVLDADGLNVLARQKKEKERSPLAKEICDAFSDYKAGVVLTPHMKEMSRLTGRSIQELVKNRIELARKEADEKHIIVMKDSRTVVTDGKGATYINVSGNHGMAVGGSGDVLTGIICAFIGEGLTPLTAAQMGVYCHGLAGDKAVKQTGYYGLMAGEIADGLNPLGIPERERR